MVISHLAKIGVERTAYHMTLQRECIIICSVYIICLTFFPTLECWINYQECGMCNAIAKPHG